MHDYILGTIKMVDSYENLASLYVVRYKDVFSLLLFTLFYFAFGTVLYSDFPCQPASCDRGAEKAYCSVNE